VYKLKSVALQCDASIRWRRLQKECVSCNPTKSIILPLSISANTNLNPSGKVTSKEQGYCPGDASGNGDSRSSEYSNVAPVKLHSAGSGLSSITLPESGSTSLIRTDSILAVRVVESCSCALRPDSESTIGPNHNQIFSSRHFFKIKNASSHEVMFISWVHMLGVERAKAMATKFGWNLPRPLQELIDASTKLRKTQD
jgi:hypothetical protein